MDEVGDLNKLMMSYNKAEVREEASKVMNKESTVLRESVFRYMPEYKGPDGEEITLYVRVWVDTILVATERDVRESYDRFHMACVNICSEEKGIGPKIAHRILSMGLVNAVEVYDESDIGTVLYKDWP